MKRAKIININYLMKHSEEIINNTSVLFPEWLYRRSKNSTDEPLLKVKMKLGKKLKIV